MTLRVNTSIIFYGNNSCLQMGIIILILVKKDMDVDEHERLSYLHLDIH